MVTLKEVNEGCYLLEAEPTRIEIGKPFIDLDQLVARTNFQLLFMDTMGSPADPGRTL